MEIKETCYKGTRILLGNKKRNLINSMVDILIKDGFHEISIPIIQYQDIFRGKVGEENNNLMFNFKDRGNRDLCLAPEYTAVIQQLAKTTFKYQKDVKLFYVQECFRGEKPQAGRYRQFTQLGVEVLNPDIMIRDWIKILSSLALNLICPNYAYSLSSNDYELNLEVSRGLDYYKEGKGFEIRNKQDLQLCGGGEYEGGIGFAIGIDRLLLN